MIEEQTQQPKSLRVRIRDWLSLYKSTQGCKLCRESHPSCLHLHHIDRDKIVNVSKSYSIGRVMSEIGKCDVLCSNCHRKVHAIESKKRVVEAVDYREMHGKERRRLWLREYTLRKRQILKEQIDQYKSSRGCQFCGMLDPECLDFHHRDLDSKIRDISRMYYGGWHIESIMADAVRCDVVCSNCHQKLHHPHPTSEEVQSRAQQILEGFRNMQRGGRKPRNVIDVAGLSAILLE